MIRTNPQIVARLAGELAERLRGARVSDVGTVADRLAIRVWHRRREIVLLMDLFGSPPIVWLEDDVEWPASIEPGFVRAVNATLGGMTVADVQARAGERILRVLFRTRSRFGVSDYVALVLELIPRFGNAILIKGDIVVAALKEFTLAENGSRAILAGQPYQPPPARATKTPVEATPQEAVLETVAREGRQRGEQSSGRGVERRRRDLERRLAGRAAKLRAELDAIAIRRDRAAGREALRAEGDAIYAQLHELNAGQREDAKERARALFAQYRKLGAALPHLDEHERRVHAVLEMIAQLEWELERAQDADLEDVEEAIAAVAGRTQRGATRVPRKAKKRAPLAWTTPTGSRILVGRTPLESVELTFRVARPRDLWFHARGVPGAHVILQRGDRKEPSHEDVLAAAALAALHSKGRNSSKVAVDYTQRKHVRKRPRAAPGLVFYTESKTVNVAPEAPLR